MKCANCQNDNPDIGKYCVFCGNPLSMISANQDNHLAEPQLKISFEDALSLLLVHHQKYISYLLSHSKNNQPYFRELLDIFIIEDSVDIFALINCQLAMQKVAISVDKLKDYGRDKLADFVIRQYSIVHIPNKELAKLAKSIFNEYILRNLSKHDFTYTFAYLNECERFSKSRISNYKDFLTSRYKEMLENDDQKDILVKILLESMLMGQNEDEYKPIAEATIERLLYQSADIQPHTMKKSIENYLDSRKIFAGFAGNFFNRYVQLVKEKIAWEKTNKLDLDKYEIKL